ncbi:hypothetical protein NXW18_00135 [Bacteroides thetaiotaomicron]|nr:hypothetical protein [Bacteroides thetaiotaomicron]MCS2872174.1 hypothetical protein [Bacteroides thetaiotaomicron]
MEGTICNANGNKIGTLQTLHDGMGRFEYTPDEKPAIAKVTYKGKQYQFKLPEALPAGYVLNVTNKPGGLAIQVSCNNETPRDTLAVFMSHQGQPFCLSADKLHSRSTRHIPDTNERHTSRGIASQFDKPRGSNSLYPIQLCYSQVSTADYHCRIETCLHALCTDSVPTSRY